MGDATGLRGSSTAGVFYIGLHESNPNETGDQTTGEGNYSPYARISVARSTAGWSVASGTADNDASITFAACTSGSDTASHFGVGSDASGAGNLFLWGALTASLAISAGVTPSFASGQLDVTLD